MAWFNNESQFNFGRYNGKKVKEVSDSRYIKWLHESHYNIYFTEEVFQRLGITHKGLIRENKHSIMIK